VTQLPFVVSIYYSLTDLKDKTQSLIPEADEVRRHRELQAIFQ